jgi:uncharacterized cupin superfamily protein
MTSLSESRLLCPDVLALALDQGGDVLAIGEAALGEVVGVEVGLWEAGPGTDGDTEVDEVSLVLSGAGRVTFEDGSSLALRPGVLLRLHAGDRTTWEVTERLRKLYVVRAG